LKTGKAAAFRAAVLLAVIIAIALIAHQYNGSIRVTVLKVQLGNIEKTFRESGVIVPLEQYPVYVLQGGQVAGVVVQEGERVKKGDPLTVIGDEELQLQHRQLEAQMDSIQGEEAQTMQSLPSEIKSRELAVKQAETDMKRFMEDFEIAQGLYENGAVTKSELDIAGGIAETSKINLEIQKEALTALQKTSKEGSGQFFEGRTKAIKAQIDMVKYKIDKCLVASPSDGVVANLCVSVGDIVSPGMRLMQIFQSGKYRVETFVLTNEVLDLRENEKVRIFACGSEKGSFTEGIIERIAPNAKEMVSALGLAERRVKVTVLPVIFEDVKWYPGSVADVEFTADYRENVLAVPRTSVFYCEDSDALWTVRAGKAAIQPVETGLENDLLVEVKGIAVGDIIITNPQIPGLKEGKKVRTK